MSNGRELCVSVGEAPPPSSSEAEVDTVYLVIGQG